MLRATRLGRAMACCAVFALPAACGGPSAALQPCHPDMPSSARLQSEPAFAPLTYRKHVDYEVMRAAAYEVWGDARFEYQSALEFRLVPPPGEHGFDRTCADAVALKLMLPLDEGRERMLKSFVAVVADGARLDANRLEATLRQRLKAEEKYGLVSVMGHVMVESGVVNHPNRGRFFQVSFRWDVGQKSTTRSRTRE